MNPLRVINSISGPLRHLAHAVPLVAAALLGLAPAAQAQPPVTSGLVLRMDASQITGTADGAQLNTWADTSGLANNAVRQGGSSTGYPMYVGVGTPNSQPVVRFNSANNNTGDYFRFTSITNIRTVFWVLKESVANTRFLLGGSGSYDFHRGINEGARLDANKIWDTNYSHANIRNGTTKLMGAAVNGTTTTLPNGSFQLISLVTAGNVQANQINQDRSYTGSWRGDIAEILIYDRALTGAEELEVGSYLSAKYALTTAYPAAGLPAAPTGVAATPVSTGAISVSWPAASGAITYNVSYTPTAGGTEEVVSEVLGLSYTIIGLTNGTSYNFKVSATNTMGTSAYSSVVTAIPALSSGKDILTFVFPGQVDTVISGTNISLTVPTGTDVTALAPTFTASPNAIGIPESGTVLDFTGTQAYTITAEDLSSQVYTVTVSVGAVPNIFTWASAVTGNWGDSAKWTNNLATGSKPIDGGQADYTLNFTQAGTYTTTQNLSNNFLLNRLNFGGAVTLAGTNSLALSSNGATLPTLNQNSSSGVVISAPLSLAADTTLGGSGNGSVSISGAITGAGSLTKTGGGTLTLSGESTFTGGANVTAGTLTLGSQTGLGTGFVTLAAGTTFQQVNFEGNSSGGAVPNAIALSGTGFVTVNMPFGQKDIWLSHAVTGTGGFTVQGGGRSLTLTADNSFSGGVTLQNYNNRIQISHVNALGTGTFRSETTAANGGQLIPLTNLSADPGVANAVDIASGAYLNVFANGSNHLKLSGAITSAVGKGNLYKDGSATLTLSGTNTYSGNTTVGAGTLNLAAGGQLKFVLGATSGVSNSISGAGTAVLDGNFLIDTTAASALSDGTWTLENVPSLTGIYGSTFTVVGYTANVNDDTWTKTASGKTWTFVESTGVLTLTTASVSDYDAWAATYVPAIVSNPAADTDGDGLSNQQEYAFGLNPTLGSSANPITAQLNKTTGMFSYTRRATPATSGFTYTVLTSTGLVTWAPDATAVQTVTGTANGVETVQVTVTGAPLTAPKFFVRVQAVPAP